MLERILGVLASLLTLINRILDRRKPASEVLSETPIIDSVQEEARKKADAKFGKKPVGKGEAPVGRGLAKDATPASEHPPDVSVVDQGALHHLPTDPPWMQRAWVDFAAGVAEIPGVGNHPRILQYLTYADNIGKWGRSREETPYCAAAVSCWLEESGHASTRHGLASRYITYGKPSKFVRGAIVVIKKRGASEDKATGSATGFHVGLLVSLEGRFITLLGANQGDRVKVSRYPRKSYEVHAIRYPLPPKPKSDAA